MYKILKLPRFSASFFVSVMVMLFLIVGTVTANHFVYLVEDSARQPGGTKANFVFFQWYAGAFLPGDSYYKLRWAAQDATVKGYMDSAIAVWQTQDDSLDIDWHGWEYITGWPQSGANIRVYHGDCITVPAARACFIRQSWSTMGTQNAQFWHQADMYIRTNLNPGTTAVPSFFAASMAHEVGHSYGLHERYLEGPPASCNNSESTIMDANKITGSPGVYDHCDSISGPTTTDKNRIEQLPA